MRKFSFLLLLVLFGCEDPEIAKLRKEAENGNTKAMFILGMKYSDENNFEKAKKMFDMILQKDPKHTDALIEIGMLYKNQKMNQILYNIVERL